MAKIVGETRCLDKVGIRWSGIPDEARVPVCVQCSQTLRKASPQLRDLQ